MTGAEKFHHNVYVILLDEAVTILGDEVAVLKTGKGLTAHIQRAPVLQLQ